MLPGNLQKSQSPDSRYDKDYRLAAFAHVYAAMRHLVSLTILRKPFPSELHEAGMAKDDTTLAETLRAGNHGVASGCVPNGPSRCQVTAASAA